MFGRALHSILFCLVFTNSLDAAPPKVPDYYAVLEVPANASEEDIKQAYRRLARQYHPDRHPNDAVAEAKMKEINQAYEIIGDREKRRQYDLQKNLITGEVIYQKRTAEMTDEEIFQEELKSFMVGLPVAEILERSARYEKQMKAVAELWVEIRPLRRAFLDIVDAPRNETDQFEPATPLNLSRQKLARMIEKWCALPDELLDPDALAKSVYCYDLFVRKFLRSLFRKQERGEFSSPLTMQEEEILIVLQSSLLLRGFLYRHRLSLDIFGPALKKYEHYLFQPIQFIQQEPWMIEPVRSMLSAHIQTSKLSFEAKKKRAQFRWAQVVQFLKRACTKEFWKT